MLLRLDGQDHYDTSYFPQKYTAVDSSLVTWTVTADGPNGKNCIQLSQDSAGSPCGYLAMAPLMTQAGPWTPTTSGISGFKFWINDLAHIAGGGSAGNDSNAIFRVFSNDRALFSVQLNQNGTFVVIRGGFGGEVLGLSAEGLTNAQWQNIEVKWAISHTTGIVQIKVDGVLVLDLQNVDNWAVPDTTDQWNSVRYLGLDTASGDADLVARICDIWLADQAGGAEEINDFLTIWDFVYIRPNGIGASSDWTPNAGVNWQAVDDVPPDGDSTYIAATAAALRDMYEMEDIPTGAIVLGFQTVILPRLESAGAATITPSFRQASVNYDAASAQGVTATGYDAYIMQPYDTNPATAVRALYTEINAAQFGLVKSA